MTITTIADKGDELTHAEMDENFTDLRDAPTGRVYPKDSGVGVLIDTANPDFGWHDIIGALKTDANDADNAPYALYRGGIKTHQFDETHDAYVDFHMPHDYLPNSAIYIHVHWSHNSTLVTGGTCTWGIETMYAKGHQQAPFNAPILITVSQAASTTQYMHMIAETAASTPGGSPVQLATEDLEVDGVFQCRVYLDSNDMTVSSGLKPDPFVHFVDIHYQSTGLPTKNKSPDFWT